MRHRLEADLPSGRVNKGEREGLGRQQASDFINNRVAVTRPHLSERSARMRPDAMQQSSGSPLVAIDEHIAGELEVQSADSRSCHVPPLVPIPRPSRSGEQLDVRAARPRVPHPCREHPRQLVDHGSLSVDPPSYGADIPAIIANTPLRLGHNSMLRCSAPGHHWSPCLARCEPDPGLPGHQPTQEWSRVPGSPS